MTLCNEELYSLGTCEQNRMLKYLFCRLCDLVLQRPHSVD